MGLKLFYSYCFLGIFLTGILIDAGLYSKIRKKQLVFCVPFVRWGFREVLFVVFLYSLFLYTLVRIEYVLFEEFRLSYLRENGLILIFNNLLLYLVVLLGLYEIVLKKARKEKVFLLNRGILKNMYIGILSYFGFIPLLVFLTTLTQLIGYFFKIDFHEQAILSLLREESSLGIMVLYAILIALVAPIVEELFFRGLVYPVFKKKIGILGAFICSSLFFSLLHWNIYVLLPIFGVGMALAFVFEITGSLVASITFHIFFNSSALFIFFISQIK
ncbi:lysostaphin resistance A-like protein [Chlamydiota bacterium]